jgi:hypothetical protein
MAPQNKMAMSLARFLGSETRIDSIFDEGR